MAHLFPGPAIHYLFKYVLSILPSLRSRMSRFLICPSNPSAAWRIVWLDPLITYSCLAWLHQVAQCLRIHIHSIIRTSKVLMDTRLILVMWIVCNHVKYCKDSWLNRFNIVTNNLAWSFSHCILFFISHNFLWHPVQYIYLSHIVTTLDIQLADTVTYTITQSLSKHGDPRLLKPPVLSLS